MFPMVSINLCVLNGENYLREALESIISQTYKDWELVIINDGSTDSTESIIREYINQGYPIVYYWQENHGIGYSRNEALKCSSGKYIAFLDCDDLWMPEKLEKQVRIMEDGTYPLCYSGVFRINDAGNVINKYIPKNKTGFLFPVFLKRYDISMPSPMMRRKIDDFDVFFKESYLFTPEFDLFFRIAATYDIAVIHEPLAKYRVSENSLTNKKIDRWWIEYKQTLDEVFLNNPVLKTTYPHEVALAYAKVSYYKARYFISVNQKIEASKELRQHIHVSVQYFLLYLLSLFPLSIWHWVHRVFKR